MKRVCCNTDCNWIGEAEDCACMKHDPPMTNFLCPECYEVTEEISDEDAEKELCA